jgi:acyl transferase domain-containing protein
MRHRPNRDRGPEPLQKEEIAIIGMACLFPNAADLDAYWQNIVGKVDAITDPPAGLWDMERSYDPGAEGNDRIYCRRGGYLGPLAAFDPIEHGVMPVAARGGEPDHWLCLDVARKALADAGYDRDVPEGRRTEVIIGKGSYLNRGNLSVLQHGGFIDQTLDILRALHPEYTDGDLESIRAELKKQLPPFDSESVPALIPNVAAGRIANRLDLMGPSYTIDAACASSLLAVDHAVRDLLGGRCDLALVGGVHLVMPAQIRQVFCQIGALSRRQEIRPFDAEADGTVMGEGIGMIVLKRFDDARRDGHRIYARIKGVGTSSDGRGLGVMAPRVEGEILALKRAYDEAGISPRTIGLIEAHGTGTPVGDATEIRALGEVFGPREGIAPWCALGTVKSMIGHLMPAAGMAGLIKAALSLYHGVLPPTLNVDEPSPSLELSRTPFYLNTEARPWVHGDTECPRRAGVNAFGFGGINAHVILEEAPCAGSSPPLGEPRDEAEVFILAAGSRPALLERCEALRKTLRERPDLDLKDLAYSLNVPFPNGSYRLSAVASSPLDLHGKLEQAIERLSESKCRKIQDARGLFFYEQPLAREGRVAFIFPGEGSQYVNMMRDMCIRYPEARLPFDVSDSACTGRTTYRPSEVLYPRAFLSEAELKALEARLWRMGEAISLVLAADYALYTIIDRLKVRPDAVVGHSTGEYAAMIAAGMIDLSDRDRMDHFACDLVELNDAMTCEETVPPASLVAVGSDCETVCDIVDRIEGDIYVAMDNCPQQAVIVGEDGAVRPAVEQLRSRGLIYERLPFDRPYHTPLFRPYAGPLRSFFDRWITALSRVPTYTCATASPFPDDLGRIRELAVEQWMQRVDFRKSIEAMYADGVRIFVEVGPRGNLSSFVDNILRGRPHAAIPADVPHRTSLVQLCHMVAMLASHGVSMELDFLYERRSPRRIRIDGPEARGEAAVTSGTRMTLETGWPRIALSEKSALRLRSRSIEGEPGGEPLCRGNGHTTSSDRPASQPGEPGELQSAEPERTSDREGLLPLELPRDAESALDEMPHPGALRTTSAQVMASHLDMMERLVAAQHEVMTAFLTGRAGPPAREEMTSLEGVGAPRSLSEPTARAEPPETQNLPPESGFAPPAPSPEPEAHKIAPPADSPAGVETPGEILLELVSQRTGYPREMLELDLDLEADLGIDSIKRVEILGALLQRLDGAPAVDMEALAGRKTLREIIELLADLSGAPPEATAGDAPLDPTDLAAAFPMIGSVSSFAPGESLEATRVLDPSEDRYLKDHTFSRGISALDPDLLPLPVMPLTMTLETMAQAAALLAPGRPLLGMRDVRAYRWVAVDGDLMALRVVARRRLAESGLEFDVQVHESGPPGTNRPTIPVAEGTMIFGDSHPESVTAGPFLLAGEQPTSRPPEQFYEEILFHGPSFRGLFAVDGLSDEGVRARLEVLPSNGLFRSTSRPSLLVDPVLLDLAGQAIGYWATEQFGDGYIYLPFRLDELTCFDSPLPAGERPEFRARITRSADGLLRADWEIVRGDGRVWARCRGWEDRCFEMPRRIISFMYSPRDSMLSDLWPPGERAPAEFAASRAFRIGLDRFPKGFFTALGAMWERTLAYTVLAPSEREEWRSLEVPAPERIGWLLGRIAAKDAVRDELRRRCGIVLCPADVLIRQGEQGRLVPEGLWASSVPAVPTVSIAREGESILAVTRFTPNGE